MQKLKVDLPFLFLTVLTTAFYMMAQFLGMKLVSIFGFTFNSGFFVLPFVFIMSNIISEVYGYKNSRYVSYVSVGCVFLLWFFMLLVMGMPAMDGWGLQSQFVFLFSDFTKDMIFEKMKMTNENKKLWLRIIVSSVVASIVGNFMFNVPMAIVRGTSIFNLLPVIYGNVFIGMLIKVGFEILFIPVIYFVCHHLRIAHDKK